MGWWKADPVPEAPRPTQSQSAPAVVPPHPVPAQPSADAASACPVDPKTRAIWLQHAQAAKSQSDPQAQTKHELPSSHPPIPMPTPSQPPQNLPSINTTPSSKECSSDRISQSPSTDPSSNHAPSRPLSHSRVVSTIPRAFPSATNSPSLPANAESETGPHSSGNWIYPSESQFFHAVMRKETLNQSSPEDLASSISSIIPIHNAVNERAWSLIKAWETQATETTSTKTCFSPKLLSFQGLGAGAKSPKARLMTLWGYTEPFDRHDWTVERCDGQQVEYVIDFYQGKAPEGGGKGKEKSNLNFYLDVRPKLNSLEGWRMRAERAMGWR
ncbi:hypothetical protein H2200_007911 [Cladophialophora chaetospira]|uniref:Holocytochrome c-type synthase n=1 Tax=Cladophialophora chaetospira TaxID=386627 RepID=A0AA38X6N4_9EURO|nr:hypothetical protein H2200_007911 [Cladophialophora chaetospira]